MSLFSLLPRVLICVVLIANGLGLAQASTRMQLAHAGEGAHVADAMGGSMGCHSGSATNGHGGMPMDHSALGHPVIGHDAGEDTRDGDPGPADCCEGSACECECIQHLSAGFSAGVLPAAILVRAGPLMEGGSQHLAPRLAHLIRPPIG